jgi:hypothetical protein
VCVRRAEPAAGLSHVAWLGSCRKVGLTSCNKISVMAKLGMWDKLVKDAASLDVILHMGDQVRSVVLLLCERGVCVLCMPHLLSR